jgi:hypothetical protein
MQNRLGGTRVTTLIRQFLNKIGMPYLDKENKKSYESIKVNKIIKAMKFVILC